MTMQDIIAQAKRDGKTAAEVQQMLREAGYNIPWLETKKLYMEAK